MELINWDGALVGPGSEWFWSAAQFVVVVISLAAIYRQLRAQGAANFLQRIDSLQGQWSSPQMAYTRLVLALHLRYEGPPADTWVKAKSIADFFVNLWDLYDAKYLSLDEIGANWGRQLQIYAFMLEPVIRERRVIEGVPNLYELEPLVAFVRAWEAKRGMPPLVLDPSTQRAFLDHTIQLLTQMLQQEQDRQSGVIPRPPEPSDRAPAPVSD